MTKYPWLQYVRKERNGLSTVGYNTYVRKEMTKYPWLQYVRKKRNGLSTLGCKNATDYDFYYIVIIIIAGNYFC